MEDKIVRAVAADASIRAFAASTKHLVERARTIHGTSPVATAALGRLLSAGAMMGCMMKGEKDLLTLHVKGSGPLKSMTVTVDSKANVKGYVANPKVELPLTSAGKLDVGRAVGAGNLSVIRDIGMKEPYHGQTALQTGEIAEDLTYYFAMSEQIPSAVGLGVLVDKDLSVKQAGGFILQLMPFASEETIRKLENKLAAIRPVTAMLEEGMLPEKILEELLGDAGLEISESVPTKFHCDCSRERVEKAIISLGKKEITSLAAAKEPIEVMCDFCRTPYTFGPEELEGFLSRM